MRKNDVKCRFVWLEIYSSFDTTSLFKLFRRVSLSHFVVFTYRSLVLRVVTVVLINS